MGDAAEVAARQMASEWFAAANRDILRLTAERDAARAEAERMRRVADAEHTKHMAVLADADRLREGIQTHRRNTQCCTECGDDQVYEQDTDDGRLWALAPPPGEPTEDGGPLPSESELPGMWEYADFMGGQDYEVRPAPIEVPPISEPCQVLTDPVEGGRCGLPEDDPAHDPLGPFGCHLYDPRPGEPTDG